jgi:hypothetical protein
MSEKVVLPKFDLPGQSTHPAVLAMRVVGGVLAAAFVVLLLAMWRHHSLQLAAEARAQAIIAERAAEAAATVEAAKAREAEAAAKIAAAKAATAAAALAKTEAPAGGAIAAVSTTGGKHHGGKHHGGKTAGKASAKTLAKTDDKKPAKPGSKRDDAAIDKLLASFNK